MTTRSATLLLWSPRILGILVCAFLGLFSLDAFGTGVTLAQPIPDFAIHVAPALILLVVVGMSWRWAWVGGLVFTALAMAYVYLARAHMSWIAAIAGPLLIVGLLFSWSWARRSR